MMKHLLNSYLLSFSGGIITTLNNIVMKKQMRGYSCNHYYEIVRDCVQGMHQRRLQTGAVNQATATLVNANVISMNFADFESLYDEVNRLIGHIRGIGPLTVYDAALKLGCSMNPRLFPVNYVYLMADAPYNAACRLYGRKLNRIEPVSSFKSEFGEVPSMFIEDFFCVMHRFILQNGKIMKVTTKHIKKELTKYIL